MGWLRKESAYEKRMRELEEEAERVRKNMQSLMKSMHQERAHSRPASAPTAGPRLAPGIRNNRPVGEVATPESDWPEPDVEGEGSEAEIHPPEMASPRSYRSASGFAPSKKSVRPDNLAHYLASGSFGKRGSLTRERKLQRDKAIFMLIFALLALFSLYSWLS